MIRPFRREDADAVAALLRRDAVPHALTGAGIRHWLASQPERARAASWVAEEDGGVDGWLRARLRWATSTEGVGELWAFVPPASRRRGVGAALYEVAHEHLRAAGARVAGIVDDRPRTEPASCAHAGSGRPASRMSCNST